MGFRQLKRCGVRVRQLKRYSMSCNDMNNAGAKAIVISLSVELSRIRDKGDYVLIIWNFNED